MTEHEVEARLRTALDHAAPDDLEGVLARCAPRSGNSPAPLPLETVRRKKARRWLPAAAAACLVLALAGGGGSWYVVNNTVASVVSLDVNPSVTLNVNAKEKVLSAVPVNEDGEDILGGMDLTGAGVDVAMNAIVGSLLQNGYVDELANSILITVEDGDAQRGARLQQELTEQADAILASAQVNGAILSQTIQNSQQLQELSDTYGITAGKAALIQTIVDNGNSLHTFEELVGLSINDLNLLYTSLVSFEPADPDEIGVIGSGDSTAVVVTAPIQSSGQASDSAYIGVEAAQSAAFAHAGLTGDQVTMGEVDFDYEDGRMVYELEFYAGGAEYEYDVDASTGDIVKASREGGWPAQSGAPSGGESTSGGSGSSGQSAGGTAGSGGDIGEQAALNIALSHAGVSQDQVYELEVQRDWDDGRLEYEVEFKAGGWEYEYTIAAADGAILDYERDD